MKSTTAIKISERGRVWFFAVPLIACLLSVTPVIGLSEDAVLTAEERAWIAKHPVIRYGADPSWPPFSIRTRDQLVGIDRSLFDLFEKRLGVRFEYVPTNQWSENLEKLKRGEIDLVSGIANLPERPLDLL